jgi:hypothetical protein
MVIQDKLRVALFKQEKKEMNEMKKVKITIVAAFIFISFFLSCQSEKALNQKSEEFSIFQFPIIEWIDSTIYNEIKQTCRVYWDLNKMIDATFEIIKGETEYSIQCDGYVEGKLFHFVIITDENGKWINDGRSISNP